MFIMKIFIAFCNSLINYITTSKNKHLCKVKVTDRTDIIKKAIHIELKYRHRIVPEMES